jgi:hypothetical protein
MQKKTSWGTVIAKAGGAAVLGAMTLWLLQWLFDKSLQAFWLGFGLSAAFLLYGTGKWARQMWRLTPQQRASREWSNYPSVPRAEDALLRQMAVSLLVTLLVCCPAFLFFASPILFWIYAAEFCVIALLLTAVIIANKGGEGAGGFIVQVLAFFVLSKIVLMGFAVFLK